MLTTRASSVNTNLFESLHARVNALAERFLPMEEEPLGEYSGEQLDEASAFILLAHAELENYLECLSTEVCDALVERVKTNHYDENTSVFLIRTADNSKQHKFIPLEVALEGQGKHAFVVRGNNGIKETDYNKLFDSLGIDVEALNPDVLSESDAFGAKRGGIAHLGVRAGIQHNVNPFEERELMARLLVHLRDFDRSLVEMFPELT